MPACASPAGPVGALGELWALVEVVPRMVEPPRYQETEEETEQEQHRSP
jgi:hypothetical protein